MVPFYTYIFICNWNMITFIDISYIKYYTSVGYSIIVLSGVYDVESENRSKISGHMTSGE